MYPTIDPQPIAAFLDPHHLDWLNIRTNNLATLRDRFATPQNDDEARIQSPHIVLQLGHDNWMEAIDPLDLRACCLARELLSTWSPLADALYALQCLGSMPIALSGSEAQKQEVLRASQSGAEILGFAMTEPEAGSDVGSMKTVATKQDGHYVIHGRKTLISNAGIANRYVVFASTDTKQGSRGLSCFVLKANTPGLVFEKAQTLGHPHPIGELKFDDCRVGPEAIIGEEGNGFRIGMTSLDRLRPTVGAAACGMATRAIFEAKQYAKSRRQFGKSLAEFQIIQSKFADMAIRLHAARLLVYRAAWEQDSGATTVSVSASMAKAFATEVAQTIIDQAIQIIGGKACLAEHPLQHLYQAVRPLRIYEGTTEIQHLLIAKHLLAKEE